MEDEWRLLSRVDLLHEQRDALLTRIPVDNLLDVTNAKYDRFHALTCRVDFFRRWVDPHGRRTMRRMSVRISEISGGYSFTQFARGSVSFVAYGQSFLSLGVYEKVMLLT